MSDHIDERPHREFYADTESLDDALSKCDLGDGYFARVYQYPHKDSLPRLTKFIEYSAYQALEQKVEAYESALKQLRTHFDNECTQNAHEYIESTLARFKK